MQPIVVNDQFKYWRMGQSMMVSGMTAQISVMERASRYGQTVLSMRDTGGMTRLTAEGG
jgi:hypothetical protein